MLTITCWLRCVMNFSRSTFRPGASKGSPLSWHAISNSPEVQGWLRRRGAEWEDRGQPVFDHGRVVTRRGDVEDHLDFVADVFNRLPAGLSCVLLHPAIDTLEIRAITSDWRGRVADFEVFRQPSLRDHIRDLGIELISYRPICDAMRRRPQAGST